MNNWQRIDDILRPSAIPKLKVGTVMTFNYEGSLHSYRIMRKTITGHVWVKRMYPVSAEALDAHAGHDVDWRTVTLEKNNGPVCDTCNVIIGPEVQPDRIQFS